MHFRQMHCSLSKRAKQTLSCTAQQRLYSGFTTGIGERWRAGCLSQVSVNRCQGHRPLHNLPCSGPPLYGGLASSLSHRDVVESLSSPLLRALGGWFQQVSAGLINPPISFVLNDSTSNRVNLMFVTTRNNSKEKLQNQPVWQNITLTHYRLPNPLSTLRWGELSIFQRWHFPQRNTTVFLNCPPPPCLPSRKRHLPFFFPWGVS